MADRAVSIHPRLPSSARVDSAWLARRNEFEQLVAASHCERVGGQEMNIRQIVPSTLFGAGQVTQIGDFIVAEEADVAFVDHQLSPVQQRNLETAWSVKVVDRTGLILEIFASRARTREGGLQVELASLNYQLGRLVRSWTHLERQRGGHGFLGGPGERQIELDRRMIRDRIQRLEKDLKQVRKMRATQRAGRERNAVQTVALVGYTNAGKSTLFNRLCQSNVHVANQLFATLDPTLRKLELPNGLSLMLSDTVGFVQDLPHELVNAFRATLEEVVEADLILHVRDIADPEATMQKQVVEQTLEQMGLQGDGMPIVVEVLNKCDLTPHVTSHITENIHGSRLALSALDGRGIEDLQALLQRWLQKSMPTYTLKIPVSDGRTLALCHEKGVVIAQQTDDEYIQMTVQLPLRYATALGCIKKDEVW
ncbi:MAG: GTPase HflX [Mariprofundaceae bacterium]|nr:GTPase HflX [Mariprofundaceae bacterium]